MAVIGNSGVGTAQNKDTDFEYYDRLSPEVRRVIQDAPFNVGCRSVAQEMRKYFPHEQPGAVLEWLAWTTREQTKSEWGKDHPQAEAETWQPLKEPRRQHTRGTNIRALNVNARTRRQPG